MIPSSTLCRAQEDLHRNRAANATLENVRSISIHAAAAWAKEAVAAESREARHLRVRAAADADIKASATVAHDDMPFSENPDRGLAYL